MNKHLWLLAMGVSMLLLQGCSQSANTADLQQFVSQALAKPRGRIEPIPVFKPYEYFSYSAAGLRSPFELPVVVDSTLQSAQASSNVRPDFDRPKEHLEQFPLGQLTMVGTMAGVDGVLWALVKDGSGSVVRIKRGYYMGQNHGRVITVSSNRLSLIEIVPNGLGGWIERPKTIALEGIGGDN
ncbi:MULTISPECIES: pilus assembly protein PilP [unclassified Oceanobacter]|uniref:pilus assembly protein PilP n=1 Tax=unclassified Oceanobacter TaxID=2620260 RepID=UPI0026E16C91|nr:MULTISPECIES: pilus assembly protein PilP [unclassified Oceanobacter]MDO6682853.1 pilus assembly protein PilP [Oceanobacter sp. 5_MG-2023]MDP2505612.1 pilus assembly protein PilP [Oceanobacter sp. 3_MG-2023]MDP2547194.1 pilus assembly protein PilP [Oceanobacter sp. 4_MG-2023]